MNATKVSVKLFASKNQSEELESYIPIFHRWIREDALDELMIDVADYTHVSKGPGVLLVGHAFDMSIDQGEGRPGLTYLRKRDLPSGSKLVTDALGRAVAAAKKLDADPEALGPKGFSTDEILFQFPDRLHLNNDEESYLRVAPAVKEAISEVGLGGGYELVREGEPRQPLTIRARAT